MIAKCILWWCVCVSCADWETLVSRLVALMNFHSYTLFVYKSSCYWDGSAAPAPVRLGEWLLSQSHRPYSQLQLTTQMCVSSLKLFTPPSLLKSPSFMFSLCVQKYFHMEFCIFSTCQCSSTESFLVIKSDWIAYLIEKKLTCSGYSYISCLIPCMSL